MPLQHNGNDDAGIIMMMQENDISPTPQRRIIIRLYNAGAMPLQHNGNDDAEIMMMMQENDIGTTP